MKKQTVVFDGDCGICEKCRDIIQFLDWFGQFDCRSNLDERIYTEFPGLTPEGCQKELKLVAASGEIFGAADAVIRICRRLPLMVPIGLIFSLPPFLQIARSLYPVIANNRYRISSQCGLKAKPGLK